MPVVCVFVFLLMSGSAFLACKYRLEFEYGLPITVAFIILIQYLFGIAGFLTAGFYAAFSVCIFLWLYTICEIKNNNKWLEFKEDFFDKGFITFIIICVLLAFSLYGMMVHVSDEYSYWGKVVKGMVYWGDFSTNKNLDIAAFSYPPGVALFQYFLEKINIFSRGEFTEWHLYFSKNIIYAAFMIPLIAKIKGKRNYIIAIFFFVSLPLLFYADFYYSLYADSTIGVLVGAALMALFGHHNTLYRHFYMLSAVFILTLIKSSGVLFASLVGIVYISVYLGDDVDRYKYQKIISVVSIIFFTYILWDIRVKMSGRHAFLSDNKIDFGILVNIIAGRDKTYRSVVHEKFLHTLIDIRVAHFKISFFGYEIKTPYILILSVILCLGIALYYILLKYEKEKILKKYQIAIFFVLIHWIIFYVGLDLTYLFKFSEVQALEIMSYDRYTNVLYLYMIMCIVYIVLLLHIQVSIKTKVILAALVSMLCILPWKSVVDFAIRGIANKTIEQRSVYTVLSDKIKSNVERDGRVYFICQNNLSWYNSEADIAIAFEAYPVHLQYGKSYFSADDAQWYTTNMNVNEFRSLLADEGWDYIAIYRQDKYFKEVYAELFENPESIADDCLYKVDHNAGLIKKIN